MLISTAWHKIDDMRQTSMATDLNQICSSKHPNSGWIGSCSYGPVINQRVNNGKPFNPPSNKRAFSKLLLGSFERHGFLELEAFHRFLLEKVTRLPLTTATCQAVMSW